MMKGFVFNFLRVTRDWTLVGLNELLIRPFFWRRPRYDKKYRISICAIFRDEARFLKEWIEFHQMIGVDHFFLYNNKSRDDYAAVLRPYVDEGTVTLYDFPKDQAQLKAYRHFYDHHRHETQWVSFLDIDEFFCPNTANGMSDWLKHYERYPVVLVYWKMFGTSGLMEHDDSKLVIEQYHVSWRGLYNVGKCLINTDYDILSWNADIHHATEVAYPILGVPVRVLPVNVFRRATKGGCFFGCLQSKRHVPAQINHYWSKAWDVYSHKMEYEGDVFFKNNPKREFQYFLRHEKMNCCSDYQIYRFLIPLKLHMLKAPDVNALD